MYKYICVECGKSIEVIGKRAEVECSCGKNMVLEKGGEKEMTKKTDNNKTKPEVTTLKKTAVKSDVKEKVLAMLTEAKTVKNVVDAIGKSNVYIRYLLKKLISEGKVEEVKPEKGPSTYVQKK